MDQRHDRQVCLTTPNGTHSDEILQEYTQKERRLALSLLNFQRDGISIAQPQPHGKCWFSLFGAFVLTV